MHEPILQTGSNMCVCGEPMEAHGTSPRCSCKAGEGCDAEGEPGCDYCKWADIELPCPAEYAADARDLLEVMIRSVWADVGATSADVLASNCVRVLAEAGLLLADADRAVLEAAQRYEAVSGDLSERVPTGNWWTEYVEARDALTAAVRARREATS